MIDAINWALAENDRPASKYAKHLNSRKIAVMGQSCGGVQAIEVAADRRVTTAMIWNSGLFANPAIWEAENSQQERSPIDSRPYRLHKRRCAGYRIQKCNCRFRPPHKDSSVSGVRTRSRSRRNLSPAERRRIQRHRGGMAELAPQGRSAGRTDVRGPGLRLVYQSEMGCANQKTEIGDITRCRAASLLYTCQLV